MTLKVSWWNTQKMACATTLQFVELLADGTLESYANGRISFRLKPDAREGNVVIESVKT